MRSINTKLIAICVLTLIVLLFLELGINYDSLDRRIALAITDISAGGGFLLVYFFLKKKYQIILPWISLLTITLAVWLDAIGNFAYFYSKYFWWDDFTHFCGTAAVSVAMFVLVVRLNEKSIFKLGRFWQGLFALSLSMFLASLYEISELWGDYLFQMTRIGGHWDTSLDLHWNFVGSVLVVIIGTKYIKNR